MARKVQTLLIDDIDGSEAEFTVRFGLDGADYEIDLSAEHADALRQLLAQYVSAARQNKNVAKRPSGGSGGGGRRSRTDGVSIAEVRDWAKAQGVEVKDRGRIPAELVVKFKAATGG